MLTQEYLKSILYYNHETGKFVRLVSTSNKVKIGDIAGSIQNTGYVAISVKNKRYLAHRLAWLYVYGSFPLKQIDHINGIRNDNRIINLRECNQYENNQNMTCRKNVTSKHIGVCWDKKRKKWRANIYVNGKQKYLGRFNSEKEALEAYSKAKIKYHQFNPIQRLT